MTLPNEQDYITAILRRLANLETHIINMIVPMQGISDALKNPEHIWKLVEILGQPLVVDDRAISRLMKDFQNSMCEFRKIFSELDVKQTISEIKYIGKRLNSIEKDLAEMKKDGMAKDIRLDFTVDGYQLVKKPIGYEKETPIEDPNKSLKDVLDTLTQREIKVLVHVLGLLGETKKTMVQIAKIFGVTPTRVRQIKEKAIRKLRHPKRAELVRKCNNLRLKEAVGIAD